MSRTQIAMRMPATTLNSYCGLGSEDLPELHLMERFLLYVHRSVCITASRSGGRMLAPGAGQVWDFAQTGSWP
jgi:hypothetical protein